MSRSPSPGFASSPTTLAGQDQFAVFATRDWYRAVARAVTKSDAEGLLQLVYAAEKALFNRWTEMSDRVNDRREGEAMESAAHKL
jgi:hypothetical protein